MTEEFKLVGFTVGDLIVLKRLMDERDLKTVADFAKHLRRVELTARHG